MIMLGEVEGARKRGRQWIRWIDRVKAITGMSLEELKVITRDKL